MKIRYIGHQSEGVTILAAGIHAPVGEPIDVDDELAKSLLEQEDNWERVTAKPKAAKKAAPSRTKVLVDASAGSAVEALAAFGEEAAKHNDQADTGQED